MIADATPMAADNAKAMRPFVPKANTVDSSLDPHFSSSAAIGVASAIIGVSRAFRSRHSRRLAI